MRTVVHIIDPVLDDPLDEEEEEDDYSYDDSDFYDHDFDDEYTPVIIVVDEPDEITF